MNDLSNYQYQKFKVGSLVVLDGRYKVKFIGENFGKAQIKSAGYQRYVEFHRIKNI